MPCEILVVDDDSDIRETLLEFLEGEGHVVRGAANGQEALDRLRQARASVILLDLMMPVMDGFEFRKQQLADPALRDIPVIVVSAGGNCERSARELGAHGCVTKPLDVTKLLDSIRAACAVPAAAMPPSGGPRSS